MAAPTKTEIYKLKDFDRPFVTSQERRESMVFTKKLFGGIRDDWQRRGGIVYVSDWTDAFAGENCQKTIASIFFLFFACLSPAIAFGGLFDSGTGGQLGAVEMILSSALSGIIYAFFAGQPTCIMGATGPELAYTLVFFEICEIMQIDFMTARVWESLWTCLFTVLLAITDSSAIMALYTRFTEEIFSALISMIFIFEALMKIVGAFLHYDFDTALFTCVLSFFTLWLALFFKKIGRGSYFTKRIRKFIADFAVTLSIITNTAIAYYSPLCASCGTDMAYLPVPDTLVPTYIDPKTSQPRPWIIPMWGTEEKPFEMWAVFFVAIPAMGLTVLGFLDQNLTSLLINRSDHKLKKPPAYHIDLLICGVFIYPICGFLGLPFTHAATVRSLAHLKSLTETEMQLINPKDPNSGTRERPSRVVEQRVSQLGIHTLMLFSLGATKLLQLLPMAVLYGIFLFMGITSMPGNELFERLELYFVWETKKMPHYHYIGKQSVQRMHAFTFLQATCLAILYGLKESGGYAGVTFPFFIAFLGPIRSLMFDKIFTKEELDCFDSKGDAEEVAFNVEEGSTVPSAMEKAVTRSASFRGDAALDSHTGRVFTAGEVQRVASMHSDDEAKKAMQNILFDKRDASRDSSRRPSVSSSPDEETVKRRVISL
jgi:hypothetical protein